MPLRPDRLTRLLTLAACLLGCSAIHAQTIDTIVFGDSASESAHGLSAPMTQVLTGGMGQTARKMLFDSADNYGEGGTLQFTAQVDPMKVNYVTVKVWGSDNNRTCSGTLELYQVENGQLYEVGYRGSYVEFPDLAWADRPEAPIPNRFFYSTVPLPLSMTQGRTSVTLRVLGSFMKANGSLPVYRAYVHLSPYFEPAANDPQGIAPAPAPIRPGTISLQAAYDKARSAVISDMTYWLANNTGNLDQLVEGYAVSWTPAYHNATVATRMLQRADSTCQAHFANPSAASSAWGGSYGALGEQIAKIGSAGFGSALDQVVDLGDPAGPATRRVLWAKMLKASRDAGRFGRRGPTSNQLIINDKSLYGAQMGLVAIGSSDALPTEDANRYLLESMGLLPYLGSDTPDGGHNTFMGANYYTVTPSGLTKEDGYVSAYGEVYDISTTFYPMTSDTRFRDRAVEMLRARSYFRYPMVDGNGYRSFRMVGTLDWRGQNTFPYDQAYGERDSRLAVAPITRDPYSIGYAHQMLEDNQGAPWGTDIGSALTLETLLDEPDSGYRLPNTEGEPDYAWCDVDNGIVAIKRGEELTWLEPYWQTRAGLHGHGRIMQITPTAARLATMPCDLQFNWNGSWFQKSEGTYSGDTSVTNTTHGLVHQAYFGDKILQNTVPSDVGAGREEYVGRASFYAMRYGRYLVGINMDQTKSYPLLTPPGFTSAVDLITKNTLSGAITVGPASAVVLDLGTTIDAAPRPITPKFIQASGVPGGISVLWNTSGGATTYTLKRATVRTGPYTTVAANLGATYPKAWAAWPSGDYLDTTAAAGTTYYYKVSGVNFVGESYDSPATIGTVVGANVPTVNPLPAPWKNVNLAGAGSASYASGAYTLTGGGGDFWASSDGGQFVYQPLLGDGTVIARLANASTAYKTGLMIRNSLDPNAIRAVMARQSGGLSGYQRSAIGAGTSGFGGGGTTTTPIWMKMERRGGIANFSWAPDVSGAAGAWTAFGSSTLAFDPTVYVGIATTTGTPVFDNLSVSTINNPASAAPDAPVGLVAQPGNGTVALSWQPADDASTYSVKRGTSASGPFSVVLTTNLSSLTYTNTGLANGTTYYYVVTASNAVGESSASAAVGATPSAAPGTPSVAVTGTQAVITWAAASGAPSYTVRRSLDGVTWQNIATGVTATTYTDNTLTNGQSYLYSIVATGSGASSPSSSAAAAAPGAPQLVDADGDDTQVRLKWTTSGGATSFRVKRAPTSGGSYTTIATNLTTPAYVDSGLTPNADYYYVVTAVNAAGESAASTAMKTGWGTGLRAQYFNNTGAAGNPVLTAIDPDAANIDWGQGSPNALVNVDNFSVLWTGQIEAATTETYTFTITDLDDGFSLLLNGATVLNSSGGVRTGTFTMVAGQKYDIRGQFYDGSGAGRVAVTWSSPTRAAEALPASRLYPGAILSSRASGGTATASVQSSSDIAGKAFDANNGTKWNAGIAITTAWLQYQFAGGTTWPVSEYRLTSASDVPQRDPAAWEFQGSNDGTTWTLLDTQTGQTFASRGLTKSYPIANPTAYAYYRLSITANAGGSAYNLQLAELALYSPTVIPAAPAGLAATPGNGQVALGWSAVSGATKYLVKRSSYNGGPYSGLAEVTTGTSFTDTGLPNGATYYYVVSSASSAGSGAQSAPVSAFVAPVPAAPSGLAATAGAAQVSLQWNASTWATSYTVKRSTTSGSGYTNLATGLNGTSYTDGSVTGGTTYYYVVSATNASGTSGNSAQVSATVSTAGGASASGNYPGETASSAFDGSTTTKWYSGANSGAAWVQYTYGTGKTVVGYAITSGNDLPERDPAAWQFQGSNNGSTWTNLNTQTGQTFTARRQTKLYSFANSTAYSYYRLNVTANSAGTGNYGVQLSELALIHTLASPWTAADIGSTGTVGAAGLNSGAFTLVGSGADIWGTADAFHYVYQSATGDCSITARVTGIQNTNGLAKAGVMIRETLNANSPQVTCNLTPNGTNEVIVRNATGAASTYTNATGIAAPYWVRLVRSGNTFTGSRSADGVTWTVTSTQTVSMGSAVYLGLPACSHASGALTLAGFDNVTAVP